jgi:hypothetical protein
MRAFSEPPSVSAARMTDLFSDEGIMRRVWEWLQIEYGMRRGCAHCGARTSTPAVCRSCGKARRRGLCARKVPPRPGGFAYGLKLLNTVRQKAGMEPVGWMLP